MNGLYGDVIRFSSSSFSSFLLLLLLFFVFLFFWSVKNYIADWCLLASARFGLEGSFCALQVHAVMERVLGIHSRQRLGVF